MAYKYTTGVVGGTFDTLHPGHKAFLRFAFSLCERVYVTITSDTYTHVHKPNATAFIERKKVLEEFLAHEGFLPRARVISIDDVYGVALDESLHIDAIIVTEDTLSGAKKVNEKRKNVGLKPLAIEIMPFVLSTTGLPISTTQLRLKSTTLFLPESVRQELKKPFGTLSQTIQDISFADRERILSVGDVTTKNLHAEGFTPAIAVIDFMIEREKSEESLESLGFHGKEKVFPAKNLASEITPSLWEALDQAVGLLNKKEKSIVLVEGEEDLAVLPLVLLAPNGYTLCYGQPHKGVVWIPVTMEVKRHAISLLSRFERMSTRGH